MTPGSDPAGPGPRARRSPQALMAATVVVGLATAATTAALGALLAVTYRPDDPWGRSIPFVEPGSDTTAGVVAHVLSASVLLIACLGALGALLWSRSTTSATGRGEPMPGRTAFGLAAPLIIAVAAALVTLATRGLVQWDHIAFRQVMVGTDISGYWMAGFDDRVRFLLIDDTEVTPGAYRTVLLVHLGAPVVAGLALWRARSSWRRALLGSQIRPPLCDSADRCRKEADADAHRRLRRPARNGEGAVGYSEVAATRPSVAGSSTSDTSTALVTPTTMIAAARTRTGPSTAADGSRAVSMAGSMSSGSE